MSNTQTTNDSECNRSSNAQGDVSELGPRDPSYTRGISDAIKTVLQRVDEKATKRSDDGFNEFNFTVGVANCFVVTVMFAAYPQHFWIVFIIQSYATLIIRMWSSTKVKPLSCVLFTLDFSYVNTLLCSIFFTYIALKGASGSVTEWETEFQKHAFLSFYGTTTGPIIVTTGIFGILMFHQSRHISFCLLLILPVLLFFTLRWYRDEVVEAWPKVFHALPQDITYWPNKDMFFGTVFGNSFTLYIMWYMPFFIWQWYTGIDLARTNRKKKLPNGDPAPTIFDTPLHYNMRLFVHKFNRFCWKRPQQDINMKIQTNDWGCRELIIFMICNVLTNLFSFTIIGWPCSHSMHVHVGIFFLLFCLCTWRGARRYKYYSTSMYTTIIKNYNFENNLEHNMSEISSIIDIVGNLNARQIDDEFSQNYELDKSLPSDCSYDSNQ